MKEKKVVFIVGSLFLLFYYGCDNSFLFKKPKEIFKGREANFPWATGVIIARVNGYPITLEDLEEEIERYNSLVPEDRPDLKIVTSEQKLSYLKDELIKRIFLYQGALKRGLADDFKMQRNLEKTKVQLFAFEIVKQETEKVNVTSSEIEEYYDKLPPEYKKEQEERKIREIMVETQDEAKHILVRLLRGEDFAALARQYSKASSAEKGGDLGFIKAGSKFKEFDTIAFSDILEVGEISSVFKGPDGYYIIKVEGEQEGKQRTVSDMWEDIKKLLTLSRQQQIIDNLVGELSRNADIEIKRELIP